jgi:hypothetical protein
LHAARLFLALTLVPATAWAAGDADRRLLQDICASDDTAAVLDIIEGYERDELLPPDAVAEALGAADALAERGYCRSAALPGEVFAAIRAESAEGSQLDVSFARGRLVAKPPRRAAVPSAGRFEGSFLVLGGPGQPLIRQ